MRQRRSLHDRLSTQSALLGLLQTHPNPALAEMAGMCGYDFLLLDGEHGVFSEADYLHALQALAAADAAAIVRLSGHDIRAVGRYMDMGADAILVPNISTAEQARTLAAALDYPPAGTRGFGAAVHRVSRYGLDLDTHMKAPRNGVCLLVIIESRLGVANVDEILAVDGVDGAIVGPSDLTADLGCAGDFSRPAFTEAVARVERAAADRGKLLGIGANPTDPLKELVERGHRLLIIGADMPLIRDALSSQVAVAKSYVGNTGRASDLRRSS
jgi:4-hydroxy-2-oxoheptanedioate aldolase